MGCLSNRTKMGLEHRSRQWMTISIFSKHSWLAGCARANSPCRVVAEMAQLFVHLWYISPQNVCCPDVFTLSDRFLPYILQTSSSDKSINYSINLLCVTTKIRSWDYDLDSREILSISRSTVKFSVKFHMILVLGIKLEMWLLEHGIEDDGESCLNQSMEPLPAGFLIFFALVNF